MQGVYRCRFCEKILNHTFADLGTSPLSNAYLTEADLSQGEIFYPLKAEVCSSCLLVQLPKFVAPESIFSDYLYFSSYSDSWLAHSKRYVEMMLARFKLKSSHTVIEIASNDGYLLQYFKAAGIPVLGVEPATNVAAVAVKEKGIPTRNVFFGVETAKEMHAEGIRADVLLANNVLAHVPDLNDFVGGMKIILAEQGVLTIEFPHLLKLMNENQFDTIYHEHFSYFSLYTLCKVFAHHGLTIFDVEEIPVHGGSLRIFVKHQQDQAKPVMDRVQDILAKEKAEGLQDVQTYNEFSKKTQKIKYDLLQFLLKAKQEGKMVAGYGAPAKGNTLLNYCGLHGDLLAFTVDRSPHKQNHYLPGSRIPIFHPDHIKKAKPDYVLILPWNLKDEIVEQMAYIKEWGGQFLVAVPSVQVVQ